MECAIGSNGKTSTSRNRGHSRFHVPSARGRAISTSGMHPKWDMPVLDLLGFILVVYFDFSPQILIFSGLGAVFTCISCVRVLLIAMPFFPG